MTASRGAFLEASRTASGPRALVRAPGPGRQSGFTLLEIIVVVLLIAISATFVVVNLERDRDALARLECERFARLVEQARDESIVSGRPYAVAVYPDENYYEFLQLRAGSDGTDDGPANGQEGEREDDKRAEWAPVEDDDSVFRRRDIPGDLNVTFELLDGGGAKAPLIVEGLGAITPFNFMIEGDDRVYAARLDAGRNVVVSDVTPE